MAFTLRGYTEEKEMIFKREIKNQKDVALLLLRWLRGKARLGVKNLAIERE